MAPRSGQGGLARPGRPSRRGREELQCGGLGTDELQPVITLDRAFVIGANPGLGAALERLSADPFALSVGPHFQEKEHQDYPLRASVAATLF